MTNKEIYSRTIGFSVRRLLFDILAFVIMAALAAAGFFIAEKTADNGLIGLVIGGVFSGIFYLIASRFPATFEQLAREMAEIAATDGDIPAFLTNPSMLTLAAAVIAGVILWDIIHSAFVRPFVLTGVLRNYLESGMSEIPTEESFAMLDSKSSKFAKLHGELA